MCAQTPCVPSDTFLCGPEAVQQRCCPADCSSPHQSPSEAKENWPMAGLTEVLLQRVPSRHHSPASCHAGHCRTPRSLWGPWSIMPPRQPWAETFSPGLWEKPPSSPLTTAVPAKPVQGELIDTGSITGMWGVGELETMGDTVRTPHKRAITALMPK